MEAVTPCRCRCALLRCKPVSLRAFSLVVPIPADPNVVKGFSTSVNSYFILNGVSPRDITSTVRTTIGSTLQSLMLSRHVAATAFTIVVAAATTSAPSNMRRLSTGGASSTYVSYNILVTNSTVAATVVTAVSSSAASVSQDLGERLVPLLPSLSGVQASATVTTTSTPYTPVSSTSLADLIAGVSGVVRRHWVARRKCRGWACACASVCALCVRTWVCVRACAWVVMFVCVWVVMCVFAWVVRCVCASVVSCQG